MRVGKTYVFDNIFEATDEVSSDSRINKFVATHANYSRIDKSTNKTLFLNTRDDWNVINHKEGVELEFHNTDCGLREVLITIIS